MNTSKSKLDIFLKVEALYRKGYLFMQSVISRVGVRQAFIFLFLLWALFFAPSVLKAEEIKTQEPVFGSFSEARLNGRWGYEIKFSADIISDKELIFKSLKEEERPFRFSRPFAFNVFWKNANTLRLEPQISLRKLEDALDKNPLELIWNKSFKSKEGRELKTVSVSSEAMKQSIRPFVFESGFQNTTGNVCNKMTIVPYDASLSASGDGSNVSLRLAFTRIMVEPEQVGLAMTMGEAPFTLTPPLPLKGIWRDQRTLVFNKDFTRSEFWAQVSDLSFDVKWKPDFKNIHGQSFANGMGHLEAFLFSRFSLVGFDQAVMNLDGWADFDLAFNKPVNKDDLAKHLSMEKFIYEKGQTVPKTKEPQTESYKAAEFKVLGTPPSVETDGTVFRIKVKAEHGERLRLGVKNLKSADGRGVIGSDSIAGPVDRFFTIAESSFKVEEQYPWRAYFTIDVHEPISFDGIEKYIKLEPALDFTVSPYGQEGRSIQIFAPFTHETNTKLTLKKGLLSQRGVLTENIEYTVAVPKDGGRKLMFTGRGRYLSPDKPLLVKLAGRNVKKLRLQAWRIYENNLATIINVQDYDQNTRIRLAQQFSNNLLDRESETKALPGQTFDRLIDLGGLLGDKPKGAYILRCSPVKNANDGSGETEDGEYYDDEYYDYSDYYYHSERYLPVMISDIGLSAHVLPGRVSVWANSLSSAKPVSHAKVKFYDQANQVAAEGLTDENGIFSAQTDPARLVFATVERGDDLNYLTFGSFARKSSDDEDFAGHDEEYDDYYDERQQWPNNGNAKWYGGDGGYLAVSAPGSSFGPMRNYLIKGYEAFLFMPRDMFKPGETVAIKAMVRDRDIAPPKEAFPVLWRINDPDGKILSQGKAEMNKNGGIDFKAEIPFFARTGSYNAEIFLPGSLKALGQVKFTVEDFVPPRLALEIKPEESIYHGDNPKINLQAHVKYLFGAPGANLNWEMDAVIFPVAFNPEGWKGFDFSAPSSDFQTTRQAGAAKGKLDDLGQAVVSYFPGLDIERLPSKTSIEFVFSAQEDGGRWNAKKARVDYFPRNVILGSKSPDSPLVKEPFVFEVAAVTPTGQAAENPELKVRIFRVVTRYFNSYRYGRHYRQAAEELVEKSVRQVALKGGRAEMNYTPEAAGAYEFHISDESTGQLLKRRVYVYGLASEKETLSSRAPVEISFDRENYLPGTQAKVKIKSPFPGRLWLTVETDEVLYSISRDMSGDELELEIPVDKTIKTNAQLTATVVRPLAEDRTVFRAIGLASLEIDRSIYNLKVSAEMPERIKPSAETRLKIKVTDGQGRPVEGEATVALVDEGVLSLSNFKTPEPWRLFTAGRILLTRFYDLYDQLLPLERNVIPFLVPGGGDGLGRSGLFSPFKRNQEILSIFIPTVMLDANGEAELELNIPEYSGQGRLMVVASGHDRFGSVSRAIRISRDLTAEPTLPLALAPGDSFEIPVRMFLAAEAPIGAGLNAEISCRAEGPLKILGENTARFNLKPGDGYNAIFHAAAEPALEGGDQAGVGRLLIDSLSGDGETFSQTIEVVVRPPYPRVSKSIGTQMEKAETSVTIDASGFLRGTAAASITLAKSPAVESARAVSWLSSYPYGCLEQTTSKAWPFVAAEDILQGLDASEDSEQHIYYGLHTAAQRLSSMQTVSGGFASWPGGNNVYEWGSVYAAHFLTEASTQIELPKNLKERSVEWLKSYLGASYSSSSDDAAYTLSTRAYALYVLALNGEYENGWYNTLRDRYDGLSPSARIFLAGAQSLRDSNSGALKELEKEKLDMSYNTLSARASSLDSGPRNLALKLLVWTEVDPLSDVAKNLANEVAAQGRMNLWRNTQENGLAVLALGKYLDKSGLGKPYEAVLFAPGGQKLLTAGPAANASVGVKALAPFLDKTLKLKITGEGRPYYTLTIGGVPLSPPTAKAEGVKLTRNWLLGDKKIPLSSEADMAETLAFTKGERVTVEIAVDVAESIQNLVVVDILPGGFEIENPKLVQPAGDEERQDDAGLGEARLEMREDRLVIIDPWIGRGRKVYRYSLRAVTCGEYALPGTAAEGMYEPDRQAILPGGRLKVK